MGYYERRYKPYKTAAEEKAQIEMRKASLMKKNKDIEPVVIEGTKIAKNWWGAAWNKNLEGYADYSNRIGRGKKYVRYGAVLDLKIEKGSIEALVQGSRKKPYDVVVEIDPLPKKKWEAIIIRNDDPDARMGCSAEGNVSHIYSSRLSSRPLGWSRTGVEKMSDLGFIAKMVARYMTWLNTKK